MSVSIETRRLLLRAPTMRDAPAIAEALGNYCLAQYLTPIPHPYSLSLAHQWLRSLPEMPEPGNATFVLDLPGVGLVGSVAIGRELGFWIAQPFWGQGFATEAARAVLAWHFAACGMEAVRSSAHYNNRASLAVQKKLGFVRTGSSSRFSVAQNRSIEHVETMLTHQAFKERL